MGSEADQEHEAATKPEVFQTLVACAFAGLIAVGYALVGMTFGAAPPAFVAGWTCLAMIVGFTLGSWVVVFAPPGILAFFLALFVLRGRATAGELFDPNLFGWRAGVTV